MNEQAAPRGPKREFSLFRSVLYINTSHCRTKANLYKPYIPWIVLLKICRFRALRMFWVVRHIIGRATEAVM